MGCGAYEVHLNDRLAGNRGIGRKDEDVYIIIVDSHISS